MSLRRKQISNVFYFKNVRKIKNVKKRLKKRDKNRKRKKRFLHLCGEQARVKAFSHKMTCLISQNIIAKSLRLKMFLYHKTM